MMITTTTLALRRASLTAGVALALISCSPPSRSPS